MSTKSDVKHALHVLKAEGLSSLMARAKSRLQKSNHAVPEKLDMIVAEITTYCNLECTGCVRTIMTDEETWTNRHVDVENFRRLVDELPPAKLFIPQGIGESTMHPRIEELIKIAAAAKKFDRIDINTNALARSTDFFAQLFAAGLTSLTISVDSLDPDTIESVRSGTDIPKLEQRLREFSERFPDKIGVRITVSRWNLAGLPGLLSRLNGLGKFNVWLQPFFDMGKVDGVLDKAQADALVAGLDELAAPCANLTVVAEPFEPSEEICMSPWRSPAIRVDGVVKPCCLIYYQEKIEFGNAFEKPFGEIWNSAEIKKFRESFVEKSPDCCARCPYYKQRG